VRDVRVLDEKTIGFLEERASGEVLSPIFDMIRGLNARAMCLHQQDADYLLGALNRRFNAI
jgi:hypothetical protein